jgi:hypothetical protein
MWLISLIIGCLILIAPFFVVSVVLGYVTGRFIRDPWVAAVASGLASLAAFWGSLVTAFALFVGNGAGAAIAFVITVFFLVALGVTPVFAVLAFLIYRNRRAKLSRGN